MSQKVFLWLSCSALSRPFRPFEYGGRGHDVPCCERFEGKTGFTKSGGGNPPRLTLGIGIAECHEAVQIREVFAESDAAAIESKSSGKDRITKFVSASLKVESPK